MTLSRLLAVAAAALIMSTSAVHQAQAQTPGAQQQERDRRSTADGERVRGELQPGGGRQATNRRGRQPTEQQIAVDAQAAATAAGLTCQVNESALLGTTNDNNDLYEVACAGGTGFILTTGTSPQTFDCLLLAAQADRIRADGGEVPAGSVCALPGNQDNLSIVAAYAREAGVPCQVDAGTAIGTTPEGNVVYEIGCAGVDGYHIEKLAQGWKKTDCLQVMSTNLTCQFTTTQEQVDGFKPLLVDTAIDDCDAERIHLLGQNDNGRFVEIKCASGEGYVARVKNDAIEQVYACALAVRIGGGCTMTEVDATEPQ